MESKTCLDLKFCYINISSLLANSNIGLPRIDILRDFCCREHSHDVILLTETHLDNTIEDSEISIEGYQLFRKDRNRHGGGILVYEKTHLLPVLFSEVDQCSLEFISVRLLRLKDHVFLGVYYRPPNQLKIERDVFFGIRATQMDRLVEKRDIKFFLFGDFNDKCVDWGDSHSGSELGQSLVTILNNYNISQMIDVSTMGANRFLKLGGLELVSCGARSFFLSPPS